MMLDHIVHLTRKKPEYIVNSWEKEGLHAVEGGKHRQWGTRNALCYTADSYIEWLSLEDEETARQANHPLPELLLHDRFGFGTVCIRTDNLEELDRRLKAEGFSTTGVVPAERQKTDGTMLRWQLLFLKEEIRDTLPAPFFIQWEEEDALRYERLRRDGTVTGANEVTQIERCVFGVENPQAAEEKWHRLLGGSLQLPNCRFDFRQTAREKERLEEVVFEKGTRIIEYENGRYVLPEKS